MSDYTITTLNPAHWNEFEHRQVVFTRIKKAGNGKTTPISQVLQLWDVETDSLIIELTLSESLEPQMTIGRIGHIPSNALGDAQEGTAE